MPKGSTGTSMGGTIEYTRMKKKKPGSQVPRRKKGACLNCAYYYKETCTFDGTPNPAKAWCENFASMRTTRNNKGVKIWQAKEQKKQR